MRTVRGGERGPFPFSRETSCQGAPLPDAEARLTRRRGGGVRGGVGRGEGSVSRAAGPELAEYVAGLKQGSRKGVTLALRQLLRFVREYPREPLVGAVSEAVRYGLYDLDRLERMILRHVTREYFLLGEEPREDD